MNQNYIEYIFLLQLLQHEKLLREAEEERLAQAVLRAQPGRRSLATKIIDWIRARIPEKDGRVETSCERHRSPQPSCMLESSG